MACSVPQIKKDSIREAKKAFIGNAPTSSFDIKERSVFMNLTRNSSKDTLYKAAENNAVRVEKWASAKFNNFRFDKPWVDIDEISYPDGIQVNFNFPSNLEQAYLQKEEKAQSQAILEQFKGGKNVVDSSENTIDENFEREETDETLPFKTDDQILEEALETLKNDKSEFEIKTGFNVNTTIEEVRESLSDNTKEEIAFAIKKINPSLEFTFTEEKSHYDGGTNQIAVNLQEVFTMSEVAELPFEEVLNIVISHELAHAKTYYGLRAGNNLKVFKDFLKRMKEIHQEFPFDDKLRGSFLDAEGNPYTFQNVDEMIGDLYSNPYFIKWLQETKYGKTNKTLLDKFIDLLKALFSNLGISKKEQESLYDVLTNLIEEKQVIQETLNRVYPDGNNELTDKLYMSNGTDKATVFEKIRNILKVEPVRDRIQESLPNIIEGLKTIKKAFYNKEAILKNKGLGLKAKDIIENIERIEQNPALIENIIMQVFSMQAMFEDLKKQMNDAIHLEDPEERLKIMYGINEIASSYSEVIEEFKNIKYSLTVTDQAGASVLNSIIPKKQIETNQAVIDSFVRMLESPEKIAGDITTILTNNSEAAVEELALTDTEDTAQEANLIRYAEIERLEKLKATSSPKNQVYITAAINKLKEEIKATPIAANNNMRAFIAQESGDVNSIRVNVESATVSAYLPIQIFASQIKDWELRAKNFMQKSLNFAYPVYQAYLKSQGLTTFSTAKINDPFLEELTVIDRMVYEEGEFKIEKQHKQFAILNEYSADYFYDIELFKHKQKALYIARAAATTNDVKLEIEKALEKLEDERIEFYKNNVKSKYNEDVNKAFELLDEKIAGTTLREYRGKLYSQLDQTIEMRDLENFPTQKEQYNQQIQELQIQLKDLYSTYGKDPSSLEYKMAVQANKYTELIKPYRENNYMTQANLEYYNSELAKKKADLASNRITKKEFDTWMSENTRVILTEEYYTKQKELSEQIDLVRQELIDKGVLSEGSKDKLKDGYTTLRDITRKYRQSDSVIDGNLVTETERESIADIQKTIQDLKDELDIKKSGLTKNQSNEYYALSKLKDARTESENTRYSQLTVLKNEAKARNIANKDLLSKYNKLIEELMSMSTSVPTEAYNKKMDDLNDKLKERIAEELKKDKIFISVDKQLEKDSTGEWVNTVTGNLITNASLVQFLTNKYKIEIIEEDEWYKKNHYKIEVWKNDRFVIEDTPLYHWKKSIPKESSHSVTKPASKYYSTKYKESALVAGYKETPTNFPMPSSAKYKNKKYEVLQKDEPKKNFLNFLRDKYYAIQLSSNNRQALLGDFIPSARKTGAQAFDGNLWGNIKENLKEAFTRTEQDIDMGYVRKDSVAEKIIPTYLTSNIDSSEQSKDILGLILQFEYFNEKRKGKVEMQAFAESLYKSSLKYSKTDKVSKGLSWGGVKDFIRGVAGKSATTKSKGIQSDGSKALREFIDRDLYGQTRVESKFAIFDKGADWLMKITAKGMFFLNLYSAAKNTFAGKLQNFISQVATPAEWARVEAIFATNAAGLFTDMLKIGGKSKLGAMLEKFEGTQGSVFQGISNKLQSNRARNSLDIFQSLKDFSEYELQVVFSILMLQKEKVKLDNGSTISLYDAYDQDKLGNLTLKSGVKFTEKQENNFIKKMHQINLEMQGAYREEEKNIAQKRMGGRLLFFMSQYFVAMGMQRYGAKTYYRNTGEFKEGFYRTAFRAIFQDWYNYKTNIVQRWPLMSQSERLATMRFLTELGTILALIGLTAALGGGDDDRYKKFSGDRLFLLALLKGVRSETETFLPGPGFNELYRKVRNPFIAAPTIGHISQLFVYSAYQLFGDEDAYYKQKSGIWKKGDSKAFATFMKLVGFKASNILMLDGKEQLRSVESFQKIR